MCWVAGLSELHIRANTLYTFLSSWLGWLCITWETPVCCATWSTPWGQVTVDWSVGGAGASSVLLCHLVWLYLRVLTLA